jgi:hypothetical protein
MSDNFDEKIKDFSSNTQKRMKEMKNRIPDYDPFKSNVVPMSDKQLNEWNKTVDEANKIISSKK